MEVNNGASLTINNSQLRAGCGNMWTGINTLPTTLPNPGSITITNSTLRDMNTGVQVNGDKPATFTGNQFVDNRYGIQLSGNTLAHNLLIDGNTFITASASLLPPLAGQIGFVGIDAQNCQKLPIGINGTSTMPSNTFDNLQTGVKIFIDNIPSVVAIDYKLINNVFRNIYGGQYGQPNGRGGVTNVYADAVGTAVFLINNSPVNNVKSLMEINTIGVNGSGIFNCEKAVTATNLSVTVSNTKVVGQRQGVWGFSMASPDKNTYKFLSNSMSDLYRGIDIPSAPVKATIDGNVIRSAPTPIAAGRFNNYPIGSRNNDPVGISLTYPLSTFSNPADITSNIVQILTTGGTGIDLMNTGSGVKLGKNLIELSPSQTVNASSVLLGVALVNCQQTSLQENTIRGNMSNNISANLTIATTSINVAGISMSASKGLILQQNQISYLKYGFLVIGDCGTGPTLVAGNCFNFHRNAMLFRELTVPGSFGDIGSAANDNNNRFINLFNSGTYYINPITRQQMKVYTEVLGPGRRPSNIYTASGINLNQPQSISAFAGSEYILRPLNPSAGISAYCNVPGAPTIAPPNNGGLALYDTASALQVAQDSVVYSLSPDVSKWLADKDLYELLSRDPAALASRPEFAAFFAQQDATLLRYIQNTDSLFADMGDSAVWSDQAVWEARLAAAQAENAQIVSPDVQEQNEQYINDAYMRYLDGGFEVLNNEIDSAQISSLALSCPYVNGSAVYKARMLYGYWVPAETYTDLEICNAVGVYKGGKSPLAERNELLNSFQPGSDDGSVELAEIAQQQEVVISPNPGTGVFALEIKGKAPKDGVLEVFNLLGQKITAVSLNGSTAQFNLAGNAAGMYYYQCRDGGVVISSGKLILNR